jgi:single-strand DNA-binding protein
MPNLNQVNLIGNITRDIETRYTPQGTAVADIGLAINRSWKDSTGEKKEETTFVDITLWGRTAEVATEYCRKGDPLFVSGRLHLDTWQDKTTGEKRAKLKVVGEQIQLLGTRQQANAASPTGNQPPQRQAAGAPPAKPTASAPQRREPAPDDSALDAEPSDCPF